MEMINGRQNTTPEFYEDANQPQKTQEDILMSESDILSGLLEASKVKDNADNYHKVQIKRGGKLLFEFRVRPLSEDENQTCRRSATKYAPSKPGQPKVAIETNPSRYRSHVIYAATINEDRAKLWDNKTALDAIQIFQGVDMIDKVLLAGEKNRVLEIIDSISGFDDVADETAKD